MAIYIYEARDKGGALIKGKIQAADANQAADKLLKDNLIPIDIKIITSETSGDSSPFSLFTPKIPNEMLAMFCRQMYSLEKAGIPIISAIKRIAEITTHVTFAHTLNEVSKEISTGTSLSKAMRHHPNVFSSLFVSLVATGEANGRLDESFLVASKHFELTTLSRRRIKTVLRYPLSVMGFAFAAILLINVFVIPRFAQLYASFHAQLPLPTRILIYISQFTQHYWWIIAIIILVISALIYYFLHHSQFRVFIDRIKLKMPIFGDTIEKIVMANFTRGLSMLLQTGVILTQALVLTADIMDNAYAREKILEMLKLIERGQNLSQAANTVHFLSPLILQILAVGEKTGSVDKLLQEATYSYEQEIDYDIKRLADRIEPVLLVFVGGIVLLLALGVFLPMWSLVYNAK